MKNSLEKVKVKNVHFFIENVLNSSLPDTKNEIQDAPSTIPGSLSQSASLG